MSKALAKKQPKPVLAKKLYIKGVATEDISSVLGITIRTIQNYKSKDNEDWDALKAANYLDGGDFATQREKILKNEESFHSELYAFNRVLMQKIKEDIAAGKEVGAGQYFALGKLASMLKGVKDYESSVKVKNEEANLNKDDVLAAVQEALGLV
jgi:hypothetical protein